MAADAVSIPEAAADVNAAQDKGERLVWTGDDGSSCSGRVHKGVVHIKRKKGGHKMTKADAMKVLACIHGYHAMAEKVRSPSPPVESFSRHSLSASFS